MTDCSFWEYRISLALDGELGPDGNDQLTRHLGECSRCRSVKDAFEKSAQTIRSWPDLADPDLLAGLEHDILQKTYRASRKATVRCLAWPAAAAALVAAFAAANIWLGPLWQRPALVAAAVAPGNRLELTFNQPMNGASWPGTSGTAPGAAAPENAPLAGSNMPAQAAKSLSRQNVPQAAHIPTTRNGSAFGTFNTGPVREAVPPYTVSRQGNRLVVSFAGALPQGPVRILVPASVRDLWGRQLDRAYLILVEDGKVTIGTP